MKKINMLIAVFAVIAAASAARAEGNVVDFDGRARTAVSEIIPSVREYGYFSGPGAVGDQPQAMVICGGKEYPANAIPMACGSELPEWIQADLLKAGGKDLNADLLGRIYLAQPKLKEMLAAQFAEAGNENYSRLLAVKGVRAVSDGKAVYLAWDKTSVKIDNPALAARAYAAVYPAVTSRLIPENKLLTEAAIVGAIGCMTSNGCWGTIGDLVSAASQDIATHYYSN